MLVILTIEKLEEEMERAVSMEGARFAVIAGKDAAVPLNLAIRLRDLKDVSFVEKGTGDAFSSGLAAGLMCGAMRKAGEDVLILSDEEIALPEGCGITAAKTLAGTEVHETEEKPAAEPKKRRTRRTKKAEPQQEAVSAEPSLLETKILSYGGNAKEYASIAADAVRDALDPIGFEMVLRMKFAAAGEDVSHAENIYEVLKDDFKSLKSLA